MADRDPDPPAPDHCIGGCGREMAGPGQCCPDCNREIQQALNQLNARDN